MKLNTKAVKQTRERKGRFLKYSLARPNSVSVGNGQSSHHHVAGSVPSWSVLVLSSQCLHVAYSVWYLTFVKAVVLAHGSETAEVETMD